ncbi:MAG: hypothetical protein CL908_21965 [Deltaproteobacteria bacterium]|nr:hypothetical protein [Deltaproteobacteria bacterium]
MRSDPTPLAPQDQTPSRSTDRGKRLHALRGRRGGDRGALVWILPLLALAVGFGTYWLLVATREKPQTRDPVVYSPFVRVMTVLPQDLRLTVVARGTVAPRTESDLVAEVRGRVLSISPQLVVGGFFAAGDDLLRLDDREHRIALQRARANVQLRESEARLASAEARRRRQLARRGAASASDLEQFESRELVASASLSEARAALEQAELDLERTVLRAPFEGRVRERNVDVGQFLSPGDKIGRVFAVDYAEVRLPIQTDELAHLDVALDTAGFSGGIEGAEVVLTGRLAGRDLRWPARLTRAEAAIDERTRMLHVVARVDDPYALGHSTPMAPEAGSAAAVEPGTAARSGGDASAGGMASDRPTNGVVLEAMQEGTVPIPPRPRVPLPAGLFVTAEIQGRRVEGVYVLPPLALRDGGKVFVYEEEEAAELEDAQVEELGYLRVRDVSVVLRDRERVVIDAGLEPGERVVISPLRIHSEGMRLRTVEAEVR